MFCPICGCELIIYEPTEPKGVNWDLTGEALSADIKRHNEEHHNWDRSQNVNCSNPKCVMHEEGGDGYMKLHHPFDLGKPRGDDSWSLSYIN